MKQHIISLTKKLISIRSTPDNRKALDSILSLIIDQLKDFTTERFENNGVKSVLIYNSKKRPRRFKILLNGHLDIIPGKDYQYSAYVKNNRLYGVASMDMKSSVASHVLLFKELASKLNYPLGLQLVTDEEIGGFNGTKYQIDRGVRSEFVIVGESTNLNIENKSKGILWATVTAPGKTAHGAYPWKGENAIWKMQRFLAGLHKKYPEYRKEKWATTINVSKIEVTNETFNKIPDNCKVSLDIRFVPEDSEIIIQKLRKLLPDTFKLDIILKEPAFSTKKNNPYLKLLKKFTGEITKKKTSVLAAHGSSDLRHFARVQCNGIEFGPVGKGMGSDNEWVDTKSLETYYKILKTFLLSLNK